MTKMRSIHLANLIFKSTTNKSVVVLFLCPEESAPTRFEVALALVVLGHGNPTR